MNVQNTTNSKTNTQPMPLKYMTSSSFEKCEESDAESDSEKKIDEIQQKYSENSKNEFYSGGEREQVSNEIEKDFKKSNNSFKRFKKIIRQASKKLQKKTKNNIEAKENAETNSIDESYTKDFLLEDNEKKFSKNDQIEEFSKSRSEFKSINGNNPVEVVKYTDSIKEGSRSSSSYFLHLDSI